MLLEGSNGTLLVYASSFAYNEEHFKPVSLAARKVAKLLKLDFEVVVFGENVKPIYVYYKNGGEEPIPIYCNKGDVVDVQDVYRALRNMMFVLSFHPRHSFLKHIRNEVMLLPS